MFCAISLFAHLFRVVSTAKDSIRSKDVPEFSPELCSKTWVPVMDHIVRQAKLSDNTLEKYFVQLTWHSISPTPKVHAIQDSVLGQTINTGENGITTICT